ncbi:uncharacterized protein LOC122509358 [Leptopilina heterotoma]|uniref:uncharacterized protein LOC122509358 n=1 Tax=Leptopilina heterotoma TaxID=63436 RepID=UPI001CA8B46B|nr:uncharacterized protein LOC122509358 [Leptopilina heterotoma]
MNDQKKSILDKLYECVNNSVDWGVKNTKHPCPPKKKSTKKGSVEDDWERKKNRQAELESNEKSETGDDQYSQGTRGDNRDFQEKSQDNSDHQKQKEIIPTEEERPCCDIQMQDPSAPCYETEEKQFKSCQCKKVYSNEPREPTSACDCSEHDRVYTGNETLFGEDIRLERA